MIFGKAGTLLLVLAAVSLSIIIPWTNAADLQPLSEDELRELRALDIVIGNPGTSSDAELNPRREANIRRDQRERQESEERQQKRREEERSQQAGQGNRGRRRGGC